MLFEASQRRRAGRMFDSFCIRTWKQTRPLTSTTCSPSSFITHLRHGSRQIMCRPSHIITIKFNVSAHNNFYRCSNTFLFTRPLPQTWEHEANTKLKKKKNSSEEIKRGRSTFRTHGTGTHRNSSYVKQKLKRIRTKGGRESSKIL